MFQVFTEKIRSQDPGRIIIWGLALAAVIEGITLVTRFGMGMQATRDTAWLASYTFGLRIHHGYYGVVLLLISIFPKKGFWKNALLIAGIGLLGSDLVHHFLVLWPVTGSPEFHFTYPQ